MTIRYLVLLYGDEAAWEHATPDERGRIIDLHGAFPQVCAEHGIAIAGGEALQTADTATTLRRRGEEITITDGPFAETAEQLGAFYLLDAPDLDSVLKAVARLPEHSLEVRPVDPAPGGS